MLLGEKLEILISRKQMSKTEFAEKIGVSKQTLYKYENDIVTNIPSDKIEIIANTLGISEAYIMGWESEEIMVEAIKDNLLSGMSERVKEYAIRLAQLSEAEQSGIFNMIDLMTKKEGKE
jgi:transcriptional regulator with XRE-family HTH domain